MVRLRPCTPTRTNGIGFRWTSGARTRRRPGSSQRHRNRQRARGGKCRPRMAPFCASTAFRRNPTRCGTMTAADSLRIFEALGNPKAATHGRGGRHPMMHRTESIDYALILSGEITMLLDDGEVLLKAGDVVVQCGTNHAWSNRSKAPCTVAFILIDGTFDPQLEARFEPALASD